MRDMRSMRSMLAVCLAVLLFVSPAVFAEEDAPQPDYAGWTTLAAANDESEDSGAGSATDIVEEPKTLEPVVVTATRVETPLKEIASSMTVITEEEIKQKQKTMVLEVLRGTPGLNVFRLGGPGTQASVLIRGAKSEHTLVLIDGIEMNDPISPGGTFNFANLTTDNIERIEILRGPQSTLYGSDAIGGVINIITKKGAGKTTCYVSGEYGEYNTFRTTVGASGGNKWGNYSFAVSRLETEGFSSADEKDGNVEKDGYKNTTVSTKLGLTPIENLDIYFVLRYDDAEVDIDGSNSLTWMFGDDPNSTQDTEEVFLRTSATLRLFDDVWEQTLGVSFTDVARDSRNKPDADDPADDKSSFDSQRVKLDWQNNFYIGESNILTIGLETEEEEGKSKSTFGDFPKKDARTDSAYVEDQIKLGDVFFITLGARVDDHEEFGSEGTYRATFAWLLEQTGSKVKYTYGTGFKAPTLFQLFAPPDPMFGGALGNPNLKPEKSEGFDIGIEQELYSGRVRFGITAFENDFEDLIGFDFVEGYINIDEAETSGVELFVSVQPLDNLMINATYTYTETEDRSTGEELLRRPKDVADVDINYQFPEKGNVNLEILYIGNRDDVDPNTFDTVKMGGYTVVNLAASYYLNENMEIFGRVENLLDREYEEVKGYGTAGLSVFGGVKLIF